VKAARVALVLLAAAAWATSIYAAHPSARASCRSGALPALGVIELAQIESQARALCKRHAAGDVIILPDGELRCSAIQPDTNPRRPA
jgi:hypothetical protein